MKKQNKASKTKTKKLKRRNTMAKAAKAKVDFQLLDNGTVKFTASPVDSVNNATTLPAGTPALAWVSDNAAITLAADPADTSGFALSQIGTPTALATGVNVTCSTTLAGGAAPITGAADPVDVIAGPAGGFAVSEA
jgi:hypothetical protein